MVINIRLDSQPVENGRLSDSVACKKQTAHKYALYLPLQYDSKISWPVIMIFDPGARGKLGVETFKNAAEKYGYILVCSYNSKNGPLNNNFTAANYLLSDINERFTLDKKRIYAAGFSGGSRFALALASSNKIIAGVIGCGAGFPSDKNLYPDTSSSFVYFGVAGNRDMNFSEMYELDSYLKKTGIVAFLQTFDGSHQWPPAEIIMDAVEWIELQAMKKTLIPVNSSFISSQSNKMMNRIVNNISNGDLYNASRFLDYGIRDFSDQPNITDFTKLNLEVRQSKEYRKAQNEWDRTIAREKSQVETYISSLENIIKSGEVSDSTLNWWRNSIIRLQNTVTSGNQVNSQMSSRILNFISILCSEQGLSFFHLGKNDLSGFLFEICTLSDPKNMNNFYNLARALASVNKRNNAIDALTKAVQLGFNIKELIEKEPAFDSIKDDERFKALLKKLE